MTTYAFIDASNLFYGGEKSLGWKIDYWKLIEYLRKKYKVTAVYYFGGVDLCGYQYDYLKNTTIPLDEVTLFLQQRLKNDRLTAPINEILTKSLNRISFYKKLETFGYQLFLKPVKVYRKAGLVQKKANCDVEMSFYLMKEMRKYQRVVVLSGDGDFLPVLKHLKEKRKTVLILSRGPRTAREIRLFAAGNFRDFEYLKYQIGMGL